MPAPSSVTPALVPSSPNPPSGNWKGTNFGGNIHLTFRGNQAFGTYGSTWNKSKKGSINLWVEGGIWKGVWEESAIGRKGILHDLVISNNGRRISGKWSVTAPGGKNSRQNVSFHLDLVTLANF